MNGASFAVAGAVAIPLVLIGWIIGEFIVKRTIEKDDK